MRIIISPAKQMRVDTDTLACPDLPVFLEKAIVLKNYLNSNATSELKEEAIKKYNNYFLDNYTDYDI